MARAPIDIRSLARSHTDMAIKILAGIAKDGLNEGARVSAAVALLDRGWGRPPQADARDTTVEDYCRSQRFYGDGARSVNSFPQA